MKSFIIVAFVLLIGSLQTAYGQDYLTIYRIMVEEKNVEAQEKVLEVWEKEKPNDPEMYVSYLNYYFNKSRQTAIPAEKEAGKFYTGSDGVYLKKDFDAGIAYIDKGIQKFPNRLDMRFGKVYAFGQIKDYKTFTSEIVKVIDLSAVNNNNWQWSGGLPLSEPKKGMLKTIQEYVAQLYGEGDQYAENIKLIAETVLKYYPDSVENLSNLAVYYLIKKDYDNALTPLLKAEKIAPQDFIILNNIAFCYYNKGDKSKAVRYYELVLKFGNDAAKQQAFEKLNELNK